MIGLEWLFAPFEAGAYDAVIWWYGATVICMTVVGIVLREGVGLDPDSPYPDDFGLAEKLASGAVMAPVFEELVFRIVPMSVGLSATLIIVCSIGWALLHGETAPVVMMTVPLYVKMTLAGMFPAMIVLHAFHNTWATTLDHVLSGEDDG